MPHDHHTSSATSVAPITTFVMPSAEDLGFYTKKRLNLYDANIQGLSDDRASRLSIAAHTDTDLLNVETMISNNLATVADAKSIASMNSLRLTSAIAEPGANTRQSDYSAPVISNLKDPIEFIYSGALPDGEDTPDPLTTADLQYIRRPISDLGSDAAAPTQLLERSSMATGETFAKLDHCAASVLTVKKMIAVAMEGSDAIKDGSEYYTQSVRELIDNNARQALIFKGSFEAMDLEEIRDAAGISGDSVNGHVYIVTAEHPNPLVGLVSDDLPYEDSTGNDLGGTTATKGLQIRNHLAQTYDDAVAPHRLSPFFVKMKADTAAERVAHSLYDPTDASLSDQQIADRYAVYNSQRCLQEDELVGLVGQSNVDGYVLGNEYYNFALHPGDLVIIQQSDHGGSAHSDLKFSFIQRNLPDDQIAHQSDLEALQLEVENTRDYLKEKINDTGTNMLYLTGLMDPPEYNGSAARRALPAEYTRDADEEYIRGLLQGTHSDVYDRYGQQITKARFLYAITDFGSMANASTSVDSDEISTNAEAAGVQLWQNLVGRQQDKLNDLNVNTDTGGNLIQPHDDNHYHNLALTCAYLQYQVNVLGRQMYLLADNDEGIPDTISGRNEILSNFQAGVTGGSSIAMDSAQRTQELGDLVVDSQTGILTTSTQDPVGGGEGGVQEGGGDGGVQEGGGI